MDEATCLACIIESCLVQNWPDLLKPLCVSATPRAITHSVIEVIHIAIQRGMEV